MFSAEESFDRIHFYCRSGTLFGSPKTLASSTDISLHSLFNIPFSACTLLLKFRKSQNSAKSLHPTVSDIGTY